MNAADDDKVEKGVKSALVRRKPPESTVAQRVAEAARQGRLEPRNGSGEGDDCGGGGASKGK